MSYDSSQDTLKHIARVGGLLSLAIGELVRRAASHDHSKLLPPEKQAFDEITPRLRGSTYGSDEYKATLREFKPAIEHHQTNNAHHPEAHPRGVDGMTLIDLVEMICDWKAASERHADGNILDSIDKNRERFGLSDQLVSILTNTVCAMNWCERREPEVAP